MSEQIDAAATVRKYVDHFNKGDVNGMASCFANPATILDGMPPHVWHGATATQDWYRDVLSEGTHLDASGYVVTLDEPRHANVTGESAYVVFPATMQFRLKDKSVTQSGATFTVALRKDGQGWRIVAWAWSKGTAKIS